jgi:bifunctional polynucleotide phosphatase/kinase
MSWRIVNDSLLIGRYGAPAATQTIAPFKKRKIAAFDFVRPLKALLS